MSIVGKWIGPDELLLYGMYIDNIVAFAARWRLDNDKY